MITVLVQNVQNLVGQPPLLQGIFRHTMEHGEEAGRQIVQCQSHIDGGWVGREGEHKSSIEGATQCVGVLVLLVPQLVVEPVRRQGQEQDVEPLRSRHPHHDVKLGPDSLHLKYHLTEWYDVLHSNIIQR